MEHELLLKECLNALNRVSEMKITNEVPMGEGQYYIYFCPVCLASSSYSGGSAVKHQDNCQLKRAVIALELVVGKEKGE